MLQSFGVLLLFAWPSAQFLFADPIISQKTNFYTIRGEDSKRLKRHMDKSHTIDNMDGTLLPTSSWLVRWNFEFEEKNNLCYLYSVRTKIEVDKVLPVWQDGEELSELQKQLWDDYFVQIQQNEDSQREAVFLAAKEIEATLGKLKPQKKCDELSRVANSIGQGILAKYRGADIRRDLKNRMAKAPSKNRSGSMN